MKRAFRIKAEDEEVKINISVNFVFTPRLFTSQEIEQKINSLREEIIDNLRHGSGHRFWFDYILV